MSIQIELPSNREDRALTGHWLSPNETSSWEYVTSNPAVGQRGPS